MTQSNEISKMEVKDKERFYHEVVENEFSSAKDLARALTGGNENTALQKRNNRRNQEKFRINASLGTNK